MASLEMLCSAERCLLLRKQKPASRFCFHCRAHRECPVSVNADRRECSCKVESVISVSGHFELNLRFNFPNLP